MNADKKYLSDLVATCEEKSGAFEQRQTLRGEEIEAINKAMEIISSGAVSGAADKHLPAAMAQVQSALVQMRAETKEGTNQARAARFLQSQANKLDSRVLAALAVRADADPFVKVRKMIKDLIVRLMEEANEESDHKAWCDTELGTNEQ